MKTSSLQNDVSALGRVLEAIEPLEDSQRLWVLQTAASRVAVKINVGSGQNGTTVVQGPSSAVGSIAAPVVGSPKAFVKAKNPQTDVQRVACLGYVLTNFRNTPHFKTKDLTELNTEAACPKFSNTAVAVDNATKAGYLTPAGKGNKQLTSLGEDLVDALPDQEKVRALASQNRRPRKKRGKTNK